MTLRRRKTDPKLAAAFETCRTLDALDVAKQEGLQLKKRGDSWWTCCPFHTEKTPSMRFNHGLWYCFGCGTGGNALGLYERLHRVDRKEAALALAGMTSLPHRSPSLPPPPREGFLDEPDADGYTWDRLCRIRQQAVEDIRSMEAAARRDAVSVEDERQGGAPDFWRAVLVLEEVERRLDDLWDCAVEASIRSRQQERK